VFQIGEWTRCSHVCKLKTLPQTSTVSSVRPSFQDAPSVTFHAAQKQRIRKGVTRRLGLTGGASGCSTSFRSRSPPTSTPEGRDRKNETDVRISCGTLFIQQCTSDMATSILAECFNHSTDSLSLDNRHISTHSYLRHKMDVNGITSRLGCRQDPLNSRPDGRHSRSRHLGKKKSLASVGNRTPDRVP
jgi:hypothetical protein